MFWNIARGMKRSASVKLLGRGSGVTSSCLAFEFSIGRVMSAGAVTVTSASAVTAGARAAQVMLGALGDADSGFSGCDSQENYNLYRSSAMHFVVDHDLMTTSAPNGVARTGEVRFTKTLWHDGYAPDMILQAVDDDGNAISDSKIAVVKSKGDIFTLRLFKNSEANVRFSFVLTGTEIVITLPEVYISVLDIDCHRNYKVCVIVVAREFFLKKEVTL